MFQQLANPNVTKSNRIAMVLQSDWSFVMRAIFGLFLMCCGALYPDIVVHDNAVMQYRDAGWTNKVAVFGEYWTQEADVVALLLTPAF